MNIKSVCWLVCHHTDLKIFSIISTIWWRTKKYWIKYNKKISQQGLEKGVDGYFARPIYFTELLKFTDSLLFNKFKTIDDINK